MSRRAIVNIFSSYNNILMTATDLTGAETIWNMFRWTSCQVFQRQWWPIRCYSLLQNVLQTHFARKNFTELIVKYRAPGGNLSNNTGPGAQAAIRALTRAGMTISRIEDVTPIAHDGTKKKGGRRGRRV